MDEWDEYVARCGCIFDVVPADSGPIFEPAVVCETHATAFIATR